jgi:hypothetical protein
MQKELSLYARIQLDLGAKIPAYSSQQQMLTQYSSAVQCCQMNSFKSTRSDVKIRHNPPRRIGQIRQKSARNWDDLRPFLP